MVTLCLMGSWSFLGYLINANFRENF